MLIFCRKFVPLKRFFTISLLLIYLISLTEFKQLVKLPILIEHFAEHKEKDDDLTLMNFLGLHYNHDNSLDIDDDSEKDMKLPFKSHDGLVNIVVIALVSNNHPVISAKPIFSLNKCYFVYSEDYIESSCLSSIWQPPKFC